MIELVLVVCSLLQPDDCRFQRPGFESVYGSMRTCVIQGQIAAVRWQDQNPDWRVRRWTCDMPRA
ncbi:MAG: hypothetical protein HKM95_17610 [Inquilinus sp.]|nr:hypothetical protein [Inquilinus sp.]